MSSVLKVLVVDDDETDREVVRRAFYQAKQPIEVVEAENEVSARNALASNAIDCILLDVRLVGTDGLTILKRLNEEHTGVPAIIMLSGLENEKLMLECLKQGAQDYLIKSELTPNILIRSVRYSKERKRIYEKLRFLAHHDSLTHLANRSLFLESVDRAISRARRNKTVLAVFFIDLDKFKNINDTLGHEVGDKLLIEVAERIRYSVRTDDLIARLGGDEYAVLIEGLQDINATIKISQLIRQVVGLPVKINGHTMHITPSIGIASYPDCDESAEGLMKCADMAMYSAKKDGRNACNFYSDQLQDVANHYREIKEGLHSALRNDDFELHYQTKVCAKTRKTQGLEALVRWRDPTRGLVQPDEFIPIAENTGVIKPLGEWVVKRACRQYREWLNNNPSHHPLTIALNLSANQLRQFDLVSRICAVAEAEEVPLTQLEFELTEHSVIQNMEMTVKTLQQLVDCGAKVAIDDFGTGYASFLHLQQLPIQTLKIDKTFISNLPTNGKDLEIVNAIITVAKALGKQVVAEGVESKAQADLLTEMGCDCLQGFYFSRPEPLENLQIRQLPCENKRAV